MNHLPPTIRHLPSTTYHLSSTTYHSSTTIYTTIINHLPSTIYQLRSTINKQPFNIYHRPSTIYHPPFTIHHLPSTIYQTLPLYQLSYLHNQELSANRSGWIKLCTHWSSGLGSCWDHARWRTPRGLYYQHGTQWRDMVWNIPKPTYME
jgi:hypothetical protein